MDNFDKSKLSDDIVNQIEKILNKDNINLDRVLKVNEACGSLLNKIMKICDSYKNRESDNETKEELKNKEECKNKKEIIVSKSPRVHKALLNRKNDLNSI
jgi:hypothetical protein